MMMTEGEDKLFSEISDVQKRKIIKVCTMAMLQQVDKSDSKLRRNKEATKNLIFTNEAQKKIGFKRAKQEMEFADFIGNHIIENKELYVGLSINASEAKVLEEMEKYGVIEPLELEHGVTTRKQQSRTITKPNSTQIRQPITKPELRPIDSRDLAGLNNPDLLHTDARTGKKEIKYGKYSKNKRQSYKCKGQEKAIILTRVGRMTYKTAFMLEANIDEYIIQTPEDREIVFTQGLDIHKIENDEQYRKVFLEQLTSHENLNLINSNGYIGDIVETDDEQNKYKVNYSEEAYTAVTELKNRLEEKMQTKKVVGDIDDR